MSQVAERARRRAMMWSLSVAVLMLAGKSLAAWLTGSAAIFSDAIESAIHLVATGFAGFSLWYASTPPDQGHPYGHGKIAYFAAAFEGLLIAAAAVVIAWVAIEDLIRGPELQQLDAGLAIIATLTLVNGGLGWYLIRTGRKYNSLVLISNGQHVLTDMWTSLGVLVGVGLVRLTGVLWLDPVAALVVAANILWTAGTLLRRSLGGLMDRADTHTTYRVLEVLNAAVEDETVANYHQVRHRRSDDQLWVEYHLMFPGEMSVREAHARSHDVEAALHEEFPDDQVRVTAHLEPRRHRDAHPPDHTEPSDPLHELSR
ncbi:MAG: cation diffusion facilitator family transporter [Longimonas sp.]|uniref:cation diffusion facilitator family transporter n=1 Tax=Longimonas sp. TaxID=2039626 RepID=UPI00334E44C0